MQSSIEKKLKQGIAAHNEGNLQEAESAYRAILQSQPQHPDANHNLGLIAILANQIEAALPLFKTALDVSPNVEQFWISYIDALTKNGQRKDAKQALKKAKKRNFDAKKIQALITKASGIAESRVPSREKLGCLLDLYHNGRYDDAEKLGKEMATDFPNHQFSWKVLGAVFSKTGRMDEAVDANRTAVTLSPRDAEAQFNLGFVLQELKKFTEAKAAYKKAIVLRPEYAEAYSNLGNMLKEVSALDEAIINYSKAVELKPDFSEAHINLGLALQELGRLEEAESSYRQAVDVAPNYAEAHYNLGVFLKELSKLGEAETRLRQAIALKPNHAKAHDHFGALLQSLGKFEEAEVHYKTYISLIPLGSFEKPLTKSLASQFFAQGKFQKALDLFDSYNTPDSRGDALKCLHALGNIREIYTRIEDSAELDDGNLRVAAFASFIAACQQKDTAHRFCKKPLEFIYTSNILSKMDDTSLSIIDLIEDLKKINTVWEPPNQSANGGFQTVGNLFRYPNRSIRRLEKIVLNEIEAYYAKFKTAQCSFIEKWPTVKKLKGWHIILKEQGYHNFHIHQDGWLSGVVYLKVVPSLDKDEGAITFNLAHSSEQYPDLPKIIYNPKAGDIVLFPSSLNHGTIPFSTETERIVVSFDLMPANSI